MEYKRIFHPTKRLVRSEHLNHHGTLFAGIGAQWFVESGFIAAADCLPPKHLVCVQIDSLQFKKSVREGEIVCYTSHIESVGKTSIRTHTKVTVGSAEEILVEGFSIFVFVDENTKPTPHRVTLIDPCFE